MKYIAFLRGINVGGHHKVPMENLRNEMTILGFENVSTLLNSGNVIFEAKETSEEKLETLISKHLEIVFGFAIPTMVRSSFSILSLIKENPFQDIEVTKEIRLHVSFLKEESSNKLELPWSSEDNSYQILELQEKAVCSVLDLSIAKTTKAMKALEEFYGKNITTRNWNTLLKIAIKCNQE